MKKEASIAEQDADSEGVEGKYYVFTPRKYADSGPDAGNGLLQAATE